MRIRRAVKRLTGSDLTLFEWHFRNKNVGNQKAINLNADVFVDLLFPLLPTDALGLGGRIPVDLFLYGPGAAGEHNLQRKIIKRDTYKNWRLDGEFIFNPEDDPTRFNSLEAGDIVVLEFQGDRVPSQVRAVFIARALESDKGLHAAFDSLLGKQPMQSLDRSELETVLSEVEPDEAHPLRELALDRALEDIALGGITEIQRVLRRRSGRRISREQLLDAKREANEVGLLGESLVNDYLCERQRRAEISELEWISERNAVAPFDFSYTETAGGRVLLDVKSTRGEFSRRIHISIGEIETITREATYHVYRIFDLTESGGRLRIATDLRELAGKVMEVLRTMPASVSADAVSMDPTLLSFDDPIALRFSDSGDVDASVG